MWHDAPIGGPSPMAPRGPDRTACRPVLLDLVLIAIGLGLLTYAADQFVMGAARLAVVLSVAPVVIGAVVVGFGTSAPELLVSALAAGRGDVELSVGNVVGSNSANLTLILGVAALITVIRIDAGILKRELPLTAAGTVVFAYAVQDGITTAEGVVLLALLAVALLVIIRADRTDDAPGEQELAAEVVEFLDADEPPAPGREALRTLLGLLGTLAGAQAMVTGATGVADELGLAEGFIGLTLVAVGTSLPELVTSVAAARKGEDELIVGNLLGSNLFNSLAVGGVIGLVGPGTIDDPDLTGFAVGIMLAVLALAAFAMITSNRVVRWEAIALLALYAVTVPMVA